jgi:hypothetical protein
MEIIDIAYILVGGSAIILALVALVLSIVLPGPKCKCDWGVENDNTYWSYVRAKVSTSDQTKNSTVKLNDGSEGAYMTDPVMFQVKNNGIKSTGPTQVFFIEGYIIGSASFGTSLQIRVDDDEKKTYTSQFGNITYVSGYYSVPKNSTVSLYTTSNITKILTGSHLSLSSTNGLVPQSFINPT